MQQVQGAMWRGGTWVNADDMVLLAHKVTALQTLLEVCRSYAGPHSIVYNKKSGSTLACGAYKSSQRPGFGSRAKQASQFKKSQTAVSTTERYFTLYVVCFIVYCTRRQCKGDSKKIHVPDTRCGLAGNGLKGLSYNYYFLKAKRSRTIIIKKTVCMLARPKKSQGRYSTRVRIGNEELSCVEI